MFTLILNASLFKPQLHILPTSSRRIPNKIVFTCKLVNFFNGNIQITEAYDQPSKRPSAYEKHPSIYVSRSESKRRGDIAERPEQTISKGACLILSPVSLSTLYKDLAIGKRHHYRLKCYKTQKRTHLLSLTIHTEQ